MPIPGRAHRGIRAQKTGPTATGRASFVPCSAAPHRRCGRLDYADSLETRVDRIAARFAPSVATPVGDAEGMAIGPLARAVMGTAPRDETRVVTADAGRHLLRAVNVARLHAPGDTRQVMLLPPLAVPPRRAG